MKLLLLSTIFVCCVLIGLYIKQYFVSKQYFYYDLLSFCDYIKLNISSSKQKLSTIIAKHKDNYHKDFSMLLDNYIEYIRGTISQQEFNKVNIKPLNEEEGQEVKYFLSDLGGLLREEEIENIALKRNVFESKHICCQQNTSKYSSVILKLFIMLGLVFFIIFI